MGAEVRISAEEVGISGGGVVEGPASGPRISSTSIGVVIAAVMVVLGGGRAVEPEGGVRRTPGFISLKACEGVGNVVSASAAGEEGRGGRLTRCGGVLCSVGMIQTSYDT